MITKKVKFLVVQNINEDMEISVGGADEISLFNADVIKKYLKKIITTKGTRLDIDLTGIHSINEDWIDTLNFLSRLARKYNSSIRLVGVEREVYEMIELIRKYYFFDIQFVKQAC
jgi:anti-anti-sigma regulatory factor